MTALSSRILELLPDARLHSEDDSPHVIIWGPPGTGKSTSLQTLLDAHLRAGHPPESILVNAFTKNATNELRRRLRRDFGIGQQEMPWLRTIHSACYSLLGLRAEQVVTGSHLRSFGDAAGWPMKGVLGSRSLEDPYGGVGVVTMGDWCYVAEELRRARRQTVEEAAATLRPPVTFATWSTADGVAFSRAWREWKAGQGLWDFTDMLEMVLRERLRPPLVRTLMVDECQDLTPLQWAVIDHWATGAERLFIFGDDSQAVFSFCGADPNELWRRPGSQFVLSHSYRLPAAIHAESQRIESRLSSGVRKDFEADREGGRVERAWDWRDLPLQEGEGSWLLLARNRIFLEGPRRHLEHEGIPFTDRTSLAGMPAPDSPLALAIEALLRLAAGEQLPRPRLRQLRTMVGTELWPGTVDVASGALSDLQALGASAEVVQRIRTAPLTALGLAVGRRDYLGRVLSQHGPQAFTRAPLVELSTIHGVKGEEANHVVVCTSMTNRTHEEYVEHPDSEHRVFYVGATRARESLTWILNGGRSYSI